VTSGRNASGFMVTLFLSFGGSCALMLIGGKLPP
jgi:hypothetical protein